jgi:hypothetical protein
MKFFVRTLGPAFLGLVFPSTAFTDSIVPGGRRAKERSKMNKFGVCTILSIAALCALLSFSPGKAYADALLSMQITGVNGLSYNGEDVYPYYGTANGNPVLLMCISYTADMDIWETWTAEKEVIPDSPTFEEAVWLFNDANAAINGTSPYTSYSPSYQIADQWAAWELFSSDAYSTAPSLAATQMAAAEANYALEPAGFYQGFILYAPVPGSQNELGTPQFFLGVGTQTPSTPPDPYGGTPTTPAYGVLPEPGSLILLGTGMFGLAGALYRRRRSA